ncbi:septin-4 isoform X2 [Cygnus olor]|uniref:septin-4 isoform X2 n=1 Tax=Cygnus olor TaxID=8869 RepID=UPI001ADE61DC|nr:septin-4 isoform X2 [Cygnus olor]
MAPNPLLPPDSDTTRDPSAAVPQPGSASTPTPRVPESPRSLSPCTVMELRSGMCLVQPVTSGHLLVALQSPLGVRRVGRQARASGRPQPGSGQGQSGGHSVTPLTSNLSQAEPPAGGCPPHDTQGALARPQCRRSRAVLLREQMTQTEPSTEVLPPPRVDVKTRLPTPPAPQRAPPAAHPTSSSPSPPPAPCSPAAITNTKLSRRATQQPRDKSSYRCVLHQASPEPGTTPGSSTLEPPPAQPGTGASAPRESRGVRRVEGRAEEQEEYRCALHRTAKRLRRVVEAEVAQGGYWPTTPSRPSPPMRDKGTQTKPVPVLPHPTEHSPEDTHAPGRDYQGPAVPLPPVLSRDVPTARALPKPGPDSAWWPLVHPEQQVAPRPVFPPMRLNATQIGFSELGAITEVTAGRGGSSEDVAELAPCGRAPATAIPQEVMSKSFPSGCDADDGDMAGRELEASGLRTFFMDLADKRHADLLWSLKDAEIKRFLKEDSEEAELTQFLRDCPPTGSPCKVEPPEGRREPGHPLCGRVPTEEPADDRDTRPFSRPRPLDAQQLITAPPPPSPSRPRSPWGQLDPYDSSEDDKEYVGFATLPNQVHRKSVKKGFDFTLMVAGESGLGKSTLVNSLFLTDMYRDRKLLNAEERITQTVEITKHVVDIEEKGVKLRLTIVDTPGFGDAVNNTECWKPVADYIDQQFEQYFRDESGLNRKNIQDNRVHCCIYFISPFGHGLRPLDVEFMRALHQRVNIVPVLAKADTLTPSEVERMKNKIREEIDHYGIRIYQFPECDSDEDEEFKLQDQALKESIPFAVIGSNTVVEAKGRRVRGRLYPWGIVEVENPSHCDFVKLRTMLVRTHMQDLKDVTRETHYENYRTQCIQSMTRMVVKERNRKRQPSTLRLCCADCSAD